jgi:hypothetical protein
MTKFRLSELARPLVVVEGLYDASCAKWAVHVRLSVLLEPYLMIGNSVQASRHSDLFSISIRTAKKRHNFIYFWFALQP